MPYGLKNPQALDSGYLSSVYWPYSELCPALCVVVSENIQSMTWNNHADSIQLSKGGNCMHSKSLCLFLLLCSLTSSVTFGQWPQPPLPTPEPIGIPNCAIYLMGIVGDTHYWATSNCPSSPSWGFGSTHGPLAAYGCNGSQCLGQVQTLLVTGDKRVNAGSLEEAKMHCTNELAYLDKVLRSGEMEDSGPGSSKPRLSSPLKKRHLSYRSA